MSVNTAVQKKNGASATVLRLDFWHVTLVLFFRSKTPPREPFCPLSVLIDNQKCMACPHGKKRGAHVLASA
jgi:hypothetical protein